MILHLSFTVFIWTTLFCTILDSNVRAFLISHSRPYAQPVSVFNYKPCIVPRSNALILSNKGTPRCIHLGSLLLSWPTINDAAYPAEIRSRDFSWDADSRLAFSKTRKCFHRQQVWTINYEYRCQHDEPWLKSTLRLKKFFESGMTARSKRWLQRRNSKRSAVHFRQNRYEIALPENALPQTHVTTVQAVHENNSLLYYSLSVPEDSRSLNLFSLDTISGEIRVARALDRETLSRHVLQITAYERLEPSISSSTTIVVDLLDVQDNAPQFERATYFAEIREDAPIGTTVMSVFARDFDDGVNGEVEYRLEDMLQKLTTTTETDLDDITSTAASTTVISHHYLTINSKSGVIQTMAPLDREVVPFIRLRVVAFDHGTPQMSSAALLEVSVVDVNDNTPHFVEFRDANGNNLNDCTISLPENISTPTTILTLHAEDFDTGSNGRVHYSVVTSVVPIFTVDYVSGAVTMRERPSLRQSPLSLSIRAKDGGQPANSVIVQCSISIFDINDHSPRFLGSINGKAVHEITVEENTPAGQELDRIFAIDEDTGANGEIHYFLNGNLTLTDRNGSTTILPATDVFVLNELTGSLSSMITFDREQQDKYHFQVLATDRGQPPLESTLSVLLIVKDINDNAPKFPQQLYELDLMENLPRGSELLKLKATDADVDSKLTYQIEFTTRNLFTLVNIGEQGAILSLTDEFSKQDEHVLVIISAIDQGGQQGRCNVSLTVHDINSAPLFAGNVYAVHIPEDSQPGFHVYRMNAVDADRDANANLTFVTDSEDFEIDAKSGLIVVKRTLDREMQSVHVVNVSVRDDGQPPLSSATTLEVVLDDVNDNAPVFQRDYYRVSISEETHIGTSFFQLGADDADDGINGVVDFFLDELDDDVRLDKFRLDRTSGTLRVNNALDREAKPRFLLPIIARDRGEPPLSSRTILQIDLEDVNDNAPYFEHHAYEFWVAENAPPGTVVGVLAATDPDFGDNARISFKIFGGADAKYFEIEDTEGGNGSGSSSTKIITRVEFDYESPTNKFFIEVQANSDQLSSIVPVIVHVSDVNDNAPQLRDFTVFIPRYDNEDETKTNHTVGNVPAFDPDLNATLEYFLEPNELISVDQNSGVLTLQKAWRYEVRASVKVCVTDGPNHACAQCQVIYVPLTDTHLVNSVSVELVGQRRDDFLDASAFRRFADALATLHDAWLPEDVAVFSVQEFHVDAMAAPGLNVSFFVSRGDTPVSSWRVEEVLANKRHALMMAIGVPVRVIDNELCAREPCAYYQKCRRTHKYVHAQREIIETDSFLFHSLNTIRSFKCECPAGFTTTDTLPGTCNQRLDLCFASPCLHNGTCVPLDGTYRCECPPRRTGQHCEYFVADAVCSPFHCHSGAKCEVAAVASAAAAVDDDGANTATGLRALCRTCRWAPVDTDGLCRLRSVSFNGDGYLLIPLAFSRLEWTFRLTFATASAFGTLLFAGVDSLGADFVHLSLQRGVLRIEMAIGDASDDHITVEMVDTPDNRVNDGEWHTAHVAYYNQKLRLWLDDCDAEVSLRLSAQAGSVSHECAAERQLRRFASKCDDASAPCHRFLDVPPFVALGGRPSPARKPQNVVGLEGGYNGCVRNVYLNDELVHFSAFDQLEQVGSGIAPGCHMYRPDICATENPCKSSSDSRFTPKCVDKWLGHLCRCPHRLHSVNGCSDTSERRADTTFTFTDKSYAVYRLPRSFAWPLELQLEFRTRERSTQLIALEFELPADYLLLSLDSGHLIAQIGNEQYLSTFPQLADGTWHSISVKLEITVFTFTIDHLYTKKHELARDTASMSAPRMLYTGLAPSSSHPRAFRGCIRNVELSGMTLAVAQQLRARPGCTTPNACLLASNACPTMSKCHRDWDRHICKCHSGFVGDWCVDVCSVEGICGAGGTCVRTASTNITHAYDCICADGRVGRNCERDAQPKMCPSGWYGEFPRCRACVCATERGFLDACHPTTGECICRPGTYARREEGIASAECVPCECGYGIRSGSVCDAFSGQCVCVGDAVGRRCDRCAGNDDDQSDAEENERDTTRAHSVHYVTKNLFHSNAVRLQRELAPDTHKCVYVRDKCPARVEFGAQWPTTSKGVTVQNPCPAGHLGMMTRVCSEANKWTAVRTNNCTLPQLIDIKVDEQSDFLSLGRLLLNATTATSSAYATTRDYALIVNTLRKIVEVVSDDTLKDQRFLRMVVAAAAQVIYRHFGATHGAKIMPAAESHVLIISLSELGRRVVRLYGMASYLRPFQIVHNNFVFAIDRFTTDATKLVLPKNDNFVAFYSSKKNLAMENPFQFTITLSTSETKTMREGAIFYMALTSNTKVTIRRDQAYRLDRVFALHGITWSNTDDNSNQRISNNASKIVPTLKSTSTTVKSIKGSVEVRFSAVENAAHIECAHFSTDVAIKTIDRASFATRNVLFTSFNNTQAICRFRTVSDGIFGLLRLREELSNSFDFSLAQSSVHTLPLCVALTLLSCGAALCTSILRREIYARPLRCAVVVFFLLNSSLFLVLQWNSIATAFCHYHKPIFTVTITGLFAWLFVYSFHIYRMLVVGDTKICGTFSFTVGILLPLCLGAITHWLNDTANCSFSAPLTSWRALWPLFVGALLLCLFSFYSIATALIMTFHSKQYYYALAKVSVRTSLLAHFVLVLLCAIHNAIYMSQFLRRNSSTAASYELQNLGNVLTVLLAIYLLIWTNLFRNRTQADGDTKSAQTMWVDDKAVTNAITNGFASESMDNGLPQKTESFLTPCAKQRTKDGRIYEGVPNEWTPDMLPSETYVHHTLERSIPQFTGSSAQVTGGQPIVVHGDNRTTIMRDGGLAKYDNISKQTAPFGSQLIAPFVPSHQQPVYYRYLNTGARSDCGVDPDYRHYSSQYNTLVSPRRHRASPSSHCGTVYSTLGRRHNPPSQCATLRANEQNASNSGTLKFATTADDEMNDAYYTYTAKRTKHTPATTFN